MKAVIYRRYGSPEFLNLEEVEKPAPLDDEVLIQIHAVSINGSDREGLIGKPLYARTGGLFRPVVRSWGQTSLGGSSLLEGTTRSSDQAMKYLGKSPAITAALRSMYARTEELWHSSQPV